MSRLTATAERLAQRAKEQAEYERELDAYIAAVKRQGGPELSRGEMHRLLFWERAADSEKAARQREAKAVEIIRTIANRPARHEPAWLRWKDWTRDDFIRAVAWDQAHGGRGGKVALAKRCLVHSSPLYRRWQMVAPNERWPSGNKGPREP